MAECQTPYCIRHKITGENIPVPCGKCPNCVKRRASGWSFRLLQEEKDSISSHFITLTYAPEHTSQLVTNNKFLSLNKRDLQLFFKRLRFAQSRESRKVLIGQPPYKYIHSIKYYAVGEYGGTSRRPHYHIIMFNADIKLIQEAWNLGQVHYGKVSGASIGYCLKYISKGKTVPQHINDDRLPEFSLMSKGLGMSYMSNEMVWWHKDEAEMENRMYCTLKDGKKISMPRYYKDKMYLPAERKRIAYFAQSKILSEKEKQMKAKGEMYWKSKFDTDLGAFNRQNFKNNQKKDKL